MQPTAYHSSTAVTRWPSVTGSDAGPARKGCCKARADPGVSDEVGEEVGEYRGCCLAVGELVAAEMVYLVPGELQFPVGGDHSRVAAGVGAAVVAGVVLEAVKFHDDASACGQQQEEVHPLPQQGGARAAGVGVVVQIHLWDQGRLIETVCPVPLAVLGEQEQSAPLPFIEARSRSYRSRPASRSEAKVLPC